MDRFEVFTTTFLKINRLISKIKALEMKEYGLKGTPIMCLYFASRQDNLTSSDLVKLCQEDKAQVSRALQELEEKGLLTYQYDNSKKKYNALIILTSQGREVGQAIINKADHVFEVCGSVLTKEERANFYDSLAKISTALTDYADCSKEK
ncbi:MAG: MarR family winged helix-turn-helix transcriptional regulator [Bacilli bacterium]